MTAMDRTGASKRFITGRINSRDVDRLHLRVIFALGAFGVIAVIYGSAVYLRVNELAKRLPDWPTGFPMLVAILFTLLTIGALVLLCIWASKGNALGDALALTSACDAETNAQVEGLAYATNSQLEEAHHLATNTADGLGIADGLLAHGAHLIGVTAQKCGLMLHQTALIPPNPNNLIRFEQPDRVRAQDRITEMSTAVDEAKSKLAAAPDFTTPEPLPNPWLTRIAERTAPPNPRFVEPCRLGETTPGRASHRRGTLRYLLIGAVVVLAATVLLIASV
jgi:hypothetical protein